MSLFPGYGLTTELTRSYPVAADNLNTAIPEGVGMIFKKPLEDGVAKVTIGSTASTDEFAGITYYQYRTLVTKLLKVDSGKVPASGSYIFNLSTIPLLPATELRVVVTDLAGASTVLAYHATTVNASQFTITGTVITVDSTHAGKTITATYAYTPSAIAARDFYGDVRPGVNNTASLGVINVIQRGVIPTMNYDPSSDWLANTPVKLDSTGRFTKAGSGVSIPNCIVKEAPSVNKPLLTLEIR